MYNQHKYLDILSKFEEGWLGGKPVLLVIFEAVLETLSDLKVSQPIGLQTSVPLPLKLLLNLRLDIEEHLFFSRDDQL